MASAREYAEWIVRNKDKKGTPDFEKVAKAYEAAKRLEGDGKKADAPATESKPKRLAQSAVTGATGVLDLAQMIGSRGASLSLPEEATLGGKARKALSDRGLARQGPPEGLWERAAEFAGAGAVPMAGIAGRGASLARAGVKEGAGLLDKMALSAVRRPGMTATTEALGSVGAAAGADYAASDAPDSELLQILAPLLGGVAAPLTLAAPTLRASQFAAGKARDMYSSVRGSGAPARAQARLAELAGPQWAERMAEEPVIPLSLGQRLASPEMVGVEQTLARMDPEFAKRLLAQEAATQDAAKGYALSGLEPADVASPLRTRRRELVRRRQREAARLGEQAEGTRAALGDPEDLTALGSGVRKDLDESLALHKQAEDEAWAQVDKAAPVTYDNAIKAYDDFITKLGKDVPQGEIIPSWVAQRLQAYKDEGGRTVGDLTEFRSFILEGMREARAAGNYKKAGFLNKLQSALLEDAKDVPGAENARRVSRELNETFRQGKVGQLLGYEDTGEAAISPEATLRSIFTGGREQVAANLGALEKASPQSMAQVENFLRTEFLNLVTEKGRVVPQAYKQFVGNSKYAEALKRFPNLRQSLMNADEAQRLAERAAATKGKVAQAVSDRNKSVLAMYLDAEPGKAVSSVMDGRDAFFNMRKLSASLKDPRARQGLQYEAVSHVLDAGTRDGKLTAPGLRAAISKYSNAMDGAGIGPDQRSRLDRVVRDLEKLETGGGREAIIDDVSAKALTYSVGTLASRAGAKAGAGTSGASLRTASKAANIAEQELNKLLNKHDKARAAVIAAVMDDNVFREMMQAPRRMAGRGQAPQFRQTRAWVLGLGSAGDDE